VKRESGKRAAGLWAGGPPKLRIVDWGMGIGKEICKIRNLKAKMGRPTLFPRPPKADFRATNFLFHGKENK
jgi:hypothetical protein